MNYYTSLVKQIDQLKAQGKIVKLTKLPSVVNIKRKSIRFWFLTTTVHLFTLLIMSKVLIHCQPSLLQTVAKLEYEFHLTNNEIDVIVDDIQDLEDDELCKHYGLNYDEVNCIEAYDFCAI